MPGLKVLKRLITVLAVVLVGAAVWLWMDLYHFAHNPAALDDTQHIIAVIPGETFNALTVKLKHNGIIADTLRFKLLARIQGNDKNLKAGEYALTAAMTPRQVLDTLVNGKVLLHRLTIPEGYNIDQIAFEVARAGLTEAKDFKARATDPTLVKRLDIEGPSVEGYLFPDTYYFPKGVTAQAIIEKMVQSFRQNFSDEWRRRADELHFSVHDIVTLASIIEKETGDPAERPIIASVFHNRLKKRMRLESDPTVIYGIENFDGNLTRRHLSTATPYNTYVIRGLPPGPIANPGRASIEAALYPAQTDYLFFVSKKDGTHHFSSTIQEHTQAVRKYQLRRRGR